MLSFYEFYSLLQENSSGQLILAKAVSKNGLDSISKSGFQLQSQHSSASKEFEKHSETNTNQMYGPGIYFSLPFSLEYLKKNCKNYADSWGNYILLATLTQKCRILVTSWGLSDNHPIWNYSVVDKKEGIYDQLQKLGISHLFPDYTPKNTHFPPEYGYKLSKSIDAWVHEHNQIPHVVVYNTKVLKYLNYFECVPQNQQKQEPLKSTNNQINNQQSKDPNVRYFGNVPLNPNSPFAKFAPKPKKDDDLNLDLDLQ